MVVLITKTRLPYNPFRHNVFVFFNFIYVQTVLKLRIPERNPDFCSECHFDEPKWKFFCNYQLCIKGQYLITRPNPIKYDVTKVIYRETLYLIELYTP